MESFLVALIALCAGAIGYGLACRNYRRRSHVVQKYEVVDKRPLIDFNQRDSMCIAAVGIGAGLLAAYTSDKWRHRALIAESDVSEFQGKFLQASERNAILVARLAKYEPKILDNFNDEAATDE